jgi:hypothetical protein
MTAFRQPKNNRKSLRRSLGTDACIRLDGGFAARPCKVMDISDTGVRIRIEAADSVPSTFSLFVSRTADSGRRARVKWRRGSQIGAEFLS